MSPERNCRDPKVGQPSRGSHDGLRRHDDIVIIVTTVLKPHSVQQSTSLNGKKLCSGSSPPKKAIKAGCKLGIE